MKELLTEFRPTILFLLKFVGFYVVGSVVYGLFITSYHPLPDPVTQWVTEQVSAVLGFFGWDTITADYKLTPTTMILFNGKSIVSVYEGCNGINVIIIFIAFVIAFGPFNKTMAWFIPVGILVIHLSNLGRIGLLFLVSLYFPQTLYFAHKYLFTAFIFLVVLVLWIWWVRKFKTREAK